MNYTLCYLEFTAKSRIGTEKYGLQKSPAFTGLIKPIKNTFRCAPLPNLNVAPCVAN
jgi:hypothetical protein